MKKFNTNRFGFSLVEVIVATSVILIFLSALIGAYNTYLSISLSNTREVKATFLTEETIEAVKLLRDTSWATSIVPLISSTPYRLSWNGNAWVSTTTNVFIDGVYDRTFTLSDVYRGVQSEIVESGGTLDPNTRKVSVSVSWREKNATTTKLVETYIADIFSN